MEQQRNPEAIKLAIRHYWQQIKADWPNSMPGLLLPGIGSVLIFYIPTLIVAKILARFSQDQGTAVSELLPFILLFAGVWALGEIIWRIAIQLLIRTEI